MDYEIFNSRTDINACDCTRGCTDTVRESALKVDLERKIPCRTGESNLRQWRAGPMLYQLGHIPAVYPSHKIFLFLFSRRGPGEPDIKVPSAENQWLSKILLTNAGVGHNIAVCASSILPCMLRLLPRDFFLANFYAPSPFICILSKTSPTFFLCWLCLIHGYCVGPQNKIGHPAGCRFPC